MNGKNMTGIVRFTSWKHVDMVYIDLFIDDGTYLLLIVFNLYCVFCLFHLSSNGGIA